MSSAVFHSIDIKLEAEAGLLNIQKQKPPAMPLDICMTNVPHLRMLPMKVPITR